jgi:hypothetical protein
MSGESYGLLNQRKSSSLEVAGRLTTFLDSRRSEWIQRELGRSLHEVKTCSRKKQTVANPRSSFHSRERANEIEKRFGPHCSVGLKLVRCATLLLQEL